MKCKVSDFVKIKGEGSKGFVMKHFNLNYYIIAHRVKPEKVEEYIKLMSTHYPRIANDPENEVHLCGSWEMIVGDLDTFGK